MTRKRFIKLCMSKGYSRNTANLLASKAQENGMCYVTAWQQAKSASQLIRSIDWDAIANALYPITEAFHEMIIAAGKAIKEFGSRIQEAFES